MHYLVTQLDKVGNDNSPDIMNVNYKSNYNNDKSPDIMKDIFTF